MDKKSNRYLSIIIMTVVDVFRSIPDCQMRDSVILKTFFSIIINYLYITPNKNLLLKNSRKLILVTETQLNCCVSGISNIHRMFLAFRLLLVVF